jgi:hypothetical protein
MSPGRPDNSHEIPISEYLTPHDFAQLSGLSISTVRRYLDDDKLPKIQPGGKRCRVLIPRNALDFIKPIEKQRPEASPDETEAPANANKDKPKPAANSGPQPRWRKRLKMKQELDICPENRPTN